ncbi:hypothetical protein Csa_004932 [Cucumis sativus]|uniref:Uncharacterized protein n=1 Tax=Cucumis sativus TaxID=3659 RepID=A0A0A0KAS2_CUCSA|nr:hypothetical protein Csa_004932 [Cucumis sativus]
MILGGEEAQEILQQSSFQIHLYRDPNERHHNVEKFKGASAIPLINLYIFSSVQNPLEIQLERPNTHFLCFLSFVGKQHSSEVQKRQGIIP